MFKKISPFFLVCVYFLLSCFLVSAQTAPEIHTIELGKDIRYIEGQHFKQGTNIDPKGTTLDLNNFFLRSGGKPILPVMGEIHYSRYPRAEWEEALLKMKAAGIQVIAFYDFWIHHQQEEGVTRFDDNLDVRYFLQLCAKHELKAVARIGPWAHGEARNGGVPDWFVKKKMKSGFDRVTKNGSVEPEVAAWYQALAKQFSGMYYKDGGPLIGIQLDNEMRSNGPGSAGYEYLSSLKKLAVSCGMDVPLYVVTGWPGPQVPEDDVIPLWGGYPDAPWTQNTKEMPPNPIYNFITDRRDKNIGNDVLSYQNGAQTPVYRHPFLTVELGGGMQVTYHRRPVLKGGDLLALDYTRLGVGANMLGYYVFQGTQHPLSWHQEYSTQESKSTIYPYPNDYPMISYDFESPITEWGEIRDYYHDFKLLHQFINSDGEILALMTPRIPADNPVKADDLTDLRYSVRSKNGAGFIFFNNYVRHFDMAKHPEVVFNIKTEKELIRIPEKGGFNVADKTYGVIPFNYDMEGVLMQYATAHPAAILDNQNKTYCYYAIDGVKPEFKFESRNIKKLTVSNGKQSANDNFLVVDNLTPGKDCRIEITTKTGKSFQILLLNKDEARYSYVFDIKGTKTLVLTSNLTFYDESTGLITMRSTGKSAFSFDTFPAINAKNNKIRRDGSEGIFARYNVHLPEWKPVNVSFKQVSDDGRYNRYVDSLSGKTPLGPTYKIRYSAEQPFKAYEIYLPKAIPKDVYDVFLDFKYEGNTAALYADGLIIADNYYAGEPMRYSLKRHADLLNKQKFVLQITPLMSKSEINFEPGTYLNFAETTHAALKGVTVFPQYQVTF